MKEHRITDRLYRGVLGMIAASLLIMNLSAAGQQKYYTTDGHIHFLSKALIEDIEAHNRDVTCIVDIGSGQVAFKVPIRSFEFEKSLMQEHFNENYMESDKYPHATFSGIIPDLPQLDPEQDSRHEVEVRGELTIHGVSRDIAEQGTIGMSNGNLFLSSNFMVVLKDHNIKRPKIMFQNIAERIAVTIEATLPPYEN